METIEERSAAVRKTVSHYKGELPKGAKKTDAGLLSYAAVQSNILTDMKQAVRQVEALRKGGNDEVPIDLSLAQFVQDKFGFGSLDSFYTALSIDPSRSTLDSLASMSDFTEGFRWLIPEVIRESIRLGLRKNPIYPSLIAADEAVTQKKVTIPSVNMSDAVASIINENETIPVGTVSFNQEDVKIHTMGTGLKISDDVMKYVSLNIISLYLQDAGVLLGRGLDTLAIDVLVNGNVGNSNSAPVVGTDSGTAIAYKDILRVWLRMGGLGKQPTGILSNEDAALDVLLLEEFLKSNQIADPRHVLDLKTPIPSSQDYLVHTASPSGAKILIFDKTTAMLKLTAAGLAVESERIVERRINGTFATVTTGFARMFRDAVVLLDGSQTIGAAPFPPYMDLTLAEGINIT